MRQIVIFLLLIVPSVSASILINNRFSMLISPLCDQTIFIDTDKNNYMEGIELLLNNSKDLQLVTSYGSYYNYTTNDKISNIKNYVSTKDFCCITYYPLNPTNNKINQDFSLKEITLFILIIICPIFTLYHFFIYLFYCLRKFFCKIALDIFKYIFK